MSETFTIRVFKRFMATPVGAPYYPQTAEYKSHEVPVRFYWLLRGEDYGTVTE